MVFPRWEAWRQAYFGTVFVLSIYIKNNEGIITTQNSGTIMFHLSDKVAPENLSLAGEFSYYVLDNALKWPYLMGYLLLAAIVLMGTFRPKWMDVLWLGALIIGLICLLI